jgi:hypothetical protein
VWIERGRCPFVGVSCESRGAGESQPTQNGPVYAECAGGRRARKGSNKRLKGSFRGKDAKRLPAPAPRCADAPLRVGPQGNAPEVVPPTVTITNPIPSPNSKVGAGSTKIFIHCTDQEGLFGAIAHALVAEAITIRNWQVGLAPPPSPTVSRAVSPSPSLAPPPSPPRSPSLPRCFPLCVSHCASHRLPQRLSYRLSHRLPHRLARRPSAPPWQCDVRGDYYVSSGEVVDETGGPVTDAATVARLQSTLALLTGQGLPDAHPAKCQDTLAEARDDWREDLAASREMLRELQSEVRVSERERGAAKKLRIVRWGFRVGRPFRDARRFPSHTIVARAGGYTYAAQVWALSIVQGAVSVAPCQTLTLRFATVASL